MRPYPDAIFKYQLELQSRRGWIANCLRLRLDEVAVGGVEALVRGNASFVASTSHDWPELLTKSLTNPRIDFILTMILCASTLATA